MFGIATITLGIGPHCSFNCLIENERLLYVTVSHVLCESGNVSETVQDRDIVTTDH